MPPPADPIARILGRQGYLVLDGGLATTLEARGHDLRDDLWSARLLLENPDAIRRAHLSFLEAGADILITSSYQAGLAGFARRGLDAAAAAKLLRLSVELALDARGDYLDARSERGSNPLVAASVGPYGAVLADGSEYRGRYDLGEADLRDFHRDRWRILAATSADLMVCETIPSLAETAALLSLLEETAACWAWFSFSCRDGLRLNDGYLFREAVGLCGKSPRVVAVGVNCTAPRYVASLITEARRVTGKPVLVYPNGGGLYDGASGIWRAAPRAIDWETYVKAWVDAGALGVGGCCRVGPEQIRRIGSVLRAH